MPGSREVANIQLWVTRDEGRSWRLYGIDEDALSPFEVKVPGEGIYGFRIVAAARSGLRGKPPQAGDLPNVTVSVDLTPPQCRIISVETTDTEEPGQLVILWEAADTTLPPRPVSIYISPSIDGNWQAIGTKLQNLGRYSWDIQEDLPEQIFIRLEVRDAAGNIATAVTPEAVSLSLLRPKATIEQVWPITSPERNAKR